MSLTVAIKIDVDTDRGTRLGVPNLLNLLADLKIQATFLFSLGPDNTGRAIRRIFRPGFLKKAHRSNVISVYGIRTLLNGVLLPAPHIGQRHEATLYATYLAHHEVGIHCYDHIRWQDGLAKMSFPEVKAELGKAQEEFMRIFKFPAKTAGAAGWQANALSLTAYDQMNFLYASDTRGHTPFFPNIESQTFQTLQIPTTLPTLDELLGRPEYPLEKLSDFYGGLLRQDTPNVWTIHAELEGMRYLPWFKACLQRFKKEGILFVPMRDIAQRCLADRSSIPTCSLTLGEIEGRSGYLAIQGDKIP